MMEKTKRLNVGDTVIEDGKKEYTVIAFALQHNSRILVVAIDKELDVHYLSGYKLEKKINKLENQ